MASPKKRGAGTPAKKPPASPAKKLASPRKRVQKALNTPTRQSSRLRSRHEQIQDEQDQAMQVDHPPRPHSPASTFGSSLTPTSQISQKHANQQPTVKQGILRQNTPLTANDREPSVHTARSLAHDLFECASQHHAENMSQPGEKGTRASTRGPTPRLDLDRDYVYRVEDMRGTEGQPTGPSRIGLYPAAPPALDGQRPHPRPRLRRSPNSIDVERRINQRRKAEAHIQAQLDQAENYHVDNSEVTVGAFPPSQWGSSGTALYPDPEPPSRINRHPVPRGMDAVIVRTDSEIARLPSEEPQNWAIDVYPSLARHIIETPAREEAEVAEILAVESHAGVPCWMYANGRIEIYADRSTPQFRQLWQFLQELGGTQLPSGSPMEGIDDDNTGTETPVGPVYGVDTTNVPIAGPSNMQIGRVNPPYLNMRMNEDPPYRGPPVGADFTRYRIKSWRAQVEPLALAGQISSLDDRSAYQGSIDYSNVGDDDDDDDNETDNEPPVIVWCSFHDKREPCSECDDELMAYA
ncbi:hypothetical protein QCA50_016721 [Cerrena zonata]|uniref:Uncharacterized protein n=1 Tax=Cerrena zonata TaxID=2478898 RepID=A0AAW0FJ03_9APHY